MSVSCLVWEKTIVTVAKLRRCCISLCFMWNAWVKMIKILCLDVWSVLNTLMPFDLSSSRTLWHTLPLDCRTNATWWNKAPWGGGNCGGSGSYSAGGSSHTEKQCWPQADPFCARNWLQLASYDPYAGHKTFKEARRRSEDGNEYCTKWRLQPRDISSATNAIQKYKSFHKWGTSIYG